MNIYSSYSLSRYRERKQFQQKMNSLSCRRGNNYTLHPWIICDPCLPRYGRIIVLPWWCNLPLSLWSCTRLEAEGSPQHRVHLHVQVCSVFAGNVKVRTGRQRSRCPTRSLLCAKAALETQGIVQTHQTSFELPKTLNGLENHNEVLGATWGLLVVFSLYQAIGPHDGKKSSRSSERQKSRKKLQVLVTLFDLLQLKTWAKVLRSWGAEGKI